VAVELELARAAQKAVGLAQQGKSAWTRADVIKYLGRVLPRSGQDPASAAGYENSELGYAVTDHVARGRTVTTGLAVITGTEDRQHVYVALTRGTDVNTAYVFTRSPKRADPVPGPRPAPELARYDRLTTGPGNQPPPEQQRR
jgi:hypothetical protein